MDNGFGTINYEEPTHDAAAGEVDAHVEDLSLDDPRLTSEPLDVNPEGDAYARQPLPPDAKYRAKLKIMQVEDAKKVKHDWLPKMHASQGAYAFTAIDATIQDPSGRYDGIHVYDRWVSTFLQRDKSHKVGTILRMLKNPANGQPWIAAGERLTHKQWLERFVKALAGEPEIGIETEWEWSCQRCGEEAKKKGEKYPRSVMGMRRFPQLAGTAGAHDPEMKCTVNPAHGFSRARVSLTRVIPLTEVK